MIKVYCIFFRPELFVNSSWVRHALYPSTCRICCWWQWW